MMKFRELLEAHRNELALLITQEHGKVLSDAAGEVTRGIEVVEFAMGAPHLLTGSHSDNIGGGIDNWNLRQRLGVVAGIRTINLPVMGPMWMFQGARVCGKTSRHKPSEREERKSRRLNLST